MKSKIVLVAGGRLQGTEITFLAKEAGYEVWAADRDPRAPAAGLADRFLKVDFHDEDLMRTYIGEADYVIPALEDEKILDRLQELCEAEHTLFLFDLEAYRISESKLRSRQLFAELGLLMAAPYPECGFPVILKPDGESGSRGVRKIDNEEELKKVLREVKEQNPDGRLVLEQFLTGPSYSLEVIGNGKEYVCSQITEVITDEDYDCCQIVAPARIPEDVAEQFYEIAAELFKAIRIRGIFDIEVIEMDHRLYLLEIDARFPSQTPISVYYSTGRNLVDIMIRLLKDRLPGEEKTASDSGGEKKTVKEKTPDKEKICYYQQILLNQGHAALKGEHIMGGSGPLTKYQAAPRADCILAPNLKREDGWRAITVVTGSTHEEARHKVDRLLGFAEGREKLY